MRDFSLPLSLDGDMFDVDGEMFSQSGMKHFAYESFMIQLPPMVGLLVPPETFRRCSCTNIFYSNHLLSRGLDLGKCLIFHECLSLASVL